MKKPLSALLLPGLIWATHATAGIDETEADMGHMQALEVRQTCKDTTFLIHTINEIDTALGHLQADGSIRQIPVPEEMQDHQAIGLGCAVSPIDDKAYFTVHYGGDCNICEWFYLYDDSGASLTDRTELFLQDSSLPEGGRASPNNASYLDKLEALGLEQPEIHFIP